MCLFMSVSEMPPKVFGQILIKFSGVVVPDQNNNHLSFGAGTQLPWRRFVLSKHLFVQYQI